MKKRKIRKIILALLLFSNNIIDPAHAQDLESIAFEYFQGVKLTTELHKDLWNINLFGPMILIDPATRKIYASEQDSLGELTPSVSVFVGTFPKSLNISGAWIEWNGKIWAMLPFPFPEGTTTTDAVGYLCHELFHRSQQKLGFVFPNEELNNHLDTKEGRLYLRLELEALNKALNTFHNNEIKRHLKNAIIFRIYRQGLFPGSKEKENMLELNEGITQYTTVILEGRSNDSATAQLIKMSGTFQSLSTYVRIFAYHTIPVYGYLLRKQNKLWNQEISMKTNLTDFFIKEFDIVVPVNIDETVKKILSEYNGEKIMAEEADREKKHLLEKKQFIKSLIENPHLEIAIKGTKMSFDPGNVLPLDDWGTVYKGNVRWSDEWGILEVKSGLMRFADGFRISVSFPEKIEHMYAKGNGWELWLNEGYQMLKNDASGNYTIKKNK